MYDSTADCTCPGQGELPTEPTEGGWYLGAPLDDLIATVPLEPPFTYYRIAQLLEHDIYGLEWEFELVSGGPVTKYGRYGQTSGTFDVWLFNVNSDNFGAGKKIQSGSTVYNQLHPEGGYQNLTDGGGKFSQNVNAPIATKGQVAAGEVYARVDSGSATVAVKNIRFIHNVNSPSHQ
jgi:hypothetical protein